MLAKKLIPFLKIPDSKELSTTDPEDELLVDMSRNDMLQLCYFFEQAGLGLPKSEMFSLMVSMKNLIRTEPLTSIRFWGKIRGLYKNYYILETELTEEEYARRNEGLEAEELNVANDENLELERISESQEIEGESDTKVPRKLPPIPSPTVEVQLDPPPESSGSGTNKKVYYICNEIGDEWTQLPDVTPQQIRVARQIKKSFTGLLTQEIITYPHFPGLEINYLRAQIARISAGTQISPLGFYTFKDEGFGEEEEEEEEAEGEEAADVVKTSYKENRKYEPPVLRDLIDSSMSFWVHHTMYILPQGRTIWWNPNPTVAIDEAAEEELGEEEGGKQPPGREPETGPPLLTPLSEDASLEAIPPWSVRTSSNILSDYSLAVVRSNLWPGAYCFTNQGKIFQNIYIGHGHKFMSHNFTPLPLPYVEQDYILGPEIMEMTDPTGEQEEQWRIDHLPPPPPEKVEEEGEEEEEEGEED
ncbi:hypothetical protein RN001_000004 [Aquatica leii]|uniref:Radial spoke head protein 6 homolog A n=1 Tax=Aquatica leii TaxID=1421715 RepID=A0AAN7PER9_9COLE|nr:hypothetical protein RN001_000004 [Aquatica leii]